LSMLDIDCLSLNYGTVRVLWDISLSLDAGESVALVGANASGKTSLLRTISGMLRPSGGKVRYEGEDIAGLEPAEVVRRGLSHVPQGRFLFPDLTVLENIESV